ncbi:MAG TPA: NADP oxidoreductase [Verrucomicrobiae bacterium]|nr:NADP oxidoreductase [Verrucomicrobiae bacterium]
MSDKPKIKVATAWLGGCSGCHMSFLDLDERLIDLVKLVEFTASPITDVKEIPEVDVGIIEGAVCNEDHEHVLRTMRVRCKVLIALGDCAVTGNIPALRNQFVLDEVLARGFLETESTQIGEIPGIYDGDDDVPKLLNRVRPIHEIVKVDAFIPGCPPDADTIWYALTELLAGRAPQWSEGNLRYD